MRQHLATLKTLNLKAKVTDLGLMKMVYTPERLKALKAIRHNIDMKTAEIDKVSVECLRRECLCLVLMVYGAWAKKY